MVYHVASSVLRRENLSRREKELPLLTKEEFAEWKEAGGMLQNGEVVEEWEASQFLALFVFFLSLHFHNS